ncbi:Hypothetical protein NTJ_02442 [Nesidiocoris tenuis]|uniref:Uncharacterized protein n=1 Tax=Nesidiocoris tenuis TaxID=355587 RepID=A0ABN7ABE1_9HEMI|nr:Hypothetical protein NTJ_02442 [Nesidiocoris tenuis]
MKRGETCIIVEAPGRWHMGRVPSGAPPHVRRAALSCRLLFRKWGVIEAREPGHGNWARQRIFHQSPPATDDTLRAARRPPSPPADPPCAVIIGGGRFRSAGLRFLWDAHVYGYALIRNMALANRSPTRKRSLGRAAISPPS